LRRKKRRNEDDVGPVQNGISRVFPIGAHIIVVCGQAVEKARREAHNGKRLI
jgi:hypothetical protein